MSFTARELQLSPSFEGYGRFVGIYTPADGERQSSYRFEYLGGTFSVPVEGTELVTLPDYGTPFQCFGRIRYNAYNGSVSLFAEKKMPLKELTDEQSIEGVKIRGLGKVVSRSSSVIQRQTFLKATLAWQGGSHLFKQVSPELFAKLPKVNDFVRFEMGLEPHTERNQNGQQVQFFIPILLSVEPEKLAVSPQSSSSSSIPSAVSAASASMMGGKKA